MKMCNMRQYRHKMSSQTIVICRVKQQADIMQNITDAGLVPGRKQNTMGLETSLGEIVKYVLSDRTPQSMDTFYSPENRAQNNKQLTGFKRTNTRIGLNLLDIIESITFFFFLK